MSPGRWSAREARHSKLINHRRHINNVVDLDLYFLKNDICSCLIKEVVFWPFFLSFPSNERRHFNFTLLSKVFFSCSGEFGHIKV